MKIFTAPNTIDNYRGESIFIGGTIDNGDSIDWQQDVINKLSTDFIIFNPRRKDWDKNLKQSGEDPKMFQQISWEYNAMKIADYILLNFLPKSLSPITLHELGLFATSGKCIVCCPKEFYRASNVEHTCTTHTIPLYRDMDTLIYDILN